MMELGSIRETIPSIFKRPVLSVEAYDPILKAATFLAIGPQVYADGVVVLDGNNTPTGRIGCKHILKHILECKGGREKEGGWWQNILVYDVMDSSVCGIDAWSSLSYALDVFSETRFAFAPITINYRIVSSLSVRDVQGFIISPSASVYTSSIATRLDRPVIDLASPIVALEEIDMNLGKILAAMIRNNVRNIGIIIHKPEKEEEGNCTMRIINDRKVLEFLLSHDGCKIISEAGIKGLYDIKVTELDLLMPRMIEPDLMVRNAAELMSVCMPCLLIASNEDTSPKLPTHIVTPWDIVMKGFYYYHA